MSSRLSETALYDQSACQSEVSRQIVPDSRSSCTEGSVAEVGARPTDKERTKSVSRARSSWTSVGDEATVLFQVAGNVPRQCLVDKDGIGNIQVCRWIFTTRSYLCLVEYSIVLLAHIIQG